MTTTSGQKTAAQSHAKIVIIPTSQTANIHAFVAMESFSIYWNGHTISYVSGQRYTAETRLKSALQATDRDLVWET